MTQGQTQPAQGETPAPYVTFTYIDRPDAPRTVNVSGEGHFPIPDLINALSQAIWNLHAQQAQMAARAAMAQRQKKIIIPDGFVPPPGF